jgi:hypothetical protein
MIPTDFATHTTVVTHAVREWLHSASAAKKMIGAAIKVG